MPKSVDSVLECRSDVSVPVSKPKVFLEHNTTFDNIRIYCSFKVKLLEEDLEDELKMNRECCKRRRPRCQICHEKRAYVKYTSLRRKFIALKRIKHLLQNTIYSASV